MRILLYKVYKKLNKLVNFHTQYLRFNIRIFLRDPIVVSKQTNKA